MTMLDTSTRLAPAEVTAVDDRYVDVLLPDGVRARARLALAVPYVPTIGDQVLVIQEDDARYVIGVLDRAGDLRIRVPSGRLVLEGESVEIRAGVLHLLAERMFQKARELYQWVAGVLQIRSGRMRTLVDSSYHVKAQRTYVKGEAEVNINGDSINLG